MSTHDADRSMSRRAFVGAATGGAALSAAGGAAAQEQEGTSSGSGGSSGATKEVLVGPGGSLVFEPADLEITPGTTVKFVWESNNHNVVVDSKPEGAKWQGTKGGAGKTYNKGYEYTHTFQTEGEYSYYCAPHRTAGMAGTITVSASSGGGPSRPQLPDSALTMGVTTIGVMASTLSLAFFFLKYGGDYESVE